MSLYLTTSSLHRPTDEVALHLFAAPTVSHDVPNRWRTFVGAHARCALAASPIPCLKRIALLAACSYILLLREFRFSQTLGSIQRIGGIDLHIRLNSHVIPVAL